MAKELDRGVNLVQLCDKEATDLMGLNSQTTVTFYQGTPPIEYLCSRVKNMVELNPWLSSRIVDEGGKVCLKYSTDMETFQVDSILKIENREHDSNRCEDDISWLGKYAVKIGRVCVNEDEPIVLITVVRLSESTFAIVFSLSHAVGDGHTFYNLYGMLNPHTKPFALQVERNLWACERIAELTADEEGYMKSLGTLVNFVSKFVWGKPCTLKNRKVKQNWVNSQKEKCAASSSTGFVSTNDVLTSTFLEATGADVGLMVANFRSRVEGLGECHAGNYQGLVGYNKPDYATSSLIRTSVASPLRRTVTPSAALYPGFISRARARVSMITNWASFYSHIDLEVSHPEISSPCRHIMHSPCFVPGGKFPFTLGIIYMLNPTDMGLYILESGTSYMEKMMQSGAVGEEILLSSLITAGGAN